MSEVFILSAARTPIGRLGGALSTIPAHQLGHTAIAEALARAEVQPGDVSEVIMGQVLTAGAGQNPARQAAVAAGIPYHVPAMGINQLCGSGLRAVAMGFEALRNDSDSTVIVAGGQENMSLAPHCIAARAGLRLGDSTLTDTVLRDGLIDAFHGYHMGQTAENIVERWKISREEQDVFAFSSQQKAAAAQAAGRFAEEIVPVKVRGRKGDTVVRNDEDIRSDSTAELLARLRPAFKSEGGTVTAGNASGINDGAAALVLVKGDSLAGRGIRPLARIVSWATTGVDPAIMGIGPVSASQLALKRAGWKLEDVDLIEANEAFAAQSCAVGRELGWDAARVNVNGGAIALGHPIGASGARILVTLLYEMRRREARRGLATLCIGGGMGIAMCVERQAA
ncbi:MAG: acetyl-CoA C-acetyltransferase [Candidatus Methylacidiphilales bacterium]|nr:acetyl-CoA C-acetyltransferase [Candidatus Methylacidiphilales bacterium]